MSGFDPVFAEEHEAYREEVRRFVAKEIDPFAETWETERDFPRDLFTKAGVAELERWLSSPEPPEPYLQSVVFAKVIVALS